MVRFDEMCFEWEQMNVCDCCLIYVGCFNFKYFMIGKEMMDFCYNCCMF